MDPNGNIYRGNADEIPPEDVARLDGYLHGRAEANARKALEAERKAVLAELEAKLAER
jgi:hypothetical protein